MNGNFDDEFKNNMDLDANKKNSQSFDNIMNNAARSTDSYFDKKNPVVRAILIVLAIIIVLGATFYIVSGLGVLK